MPPNIRKQKPVMTERWKMDKKTVPVTDSGEFPNHDTGRRKPSKTRWS